MTQGTVVIAGAGHAGFQVAASLRQHGFAERICLINDEAHLPYQRPPLSKAYLKGEGRPDSLMFRPDKFYRDQNIELIADRAAAIDRGARKLNLASGSSLDFWHLVLAIWLILLGVVWMDWISFDNSTDILGIGAIVTGVLVLIDK